MEKKQDKPPVNFRRLMFLALSIAFTCISLYNGFFLYKARYGVEIAVMISVAMESGSMSLFFFALYTPWRAVSHVPVIVAIVLLRLCCGVVNYTAFVYDVQKANVQNVQEVYKKYQKVLPLYDTYVHGLKNVQMKDVVYNAMKAKEYKGAAGYLEANAVRLEQYREEKAYLEKAYEITPENIAEFMPMVVRMASKTGAIIETGTNASETAIRAVWGVSSKKVDIVAAGFYSSLIELMIVFFVLMGYFSKVQNVQNVQNDAGFMSVESPKCTPVEKCTRVPRKSTMKKWLDYRIKHGEWKDKSKINRSNAAFYAEFIEQDHLQLKGEK